MQYLHLTLDKFQVDSIHAIDQGKSVVVSAPTGSGKTLIANYLIDVKLKEKKRVVYTAPIKALSNQKFKEFTKLYGEEAIGLMTGDTVINPHAPIIIMTTEIYRNMVLVNDSTVDKVAYVVFDEIHYINDRERGYVWEESIIFSPKEVRFLCLSATIPNAAEFADWISKIKHHKVETIEHHRRAVPLTHKFFENSTGVVDLKKIHDRMAIPEYKHAFRHKRRGPRQRVDPPDHTACIKALGTKVPALFFSFSRAACQKKGIELAQKRFFPHMPEISTIIREKLKNAPPDINKISATKALREILPYQIGFHHAGLLPVLKELVEELFGKGLIKVLYTTETFAVGINMPARTVCFDSLKKFDGYSLRYLNTKEYFQMAGRAGRRGIDTQGLVVTMVHLPTFEYNKVKQITQADVMPIHSQFRLSINTVLNMIKLHSEAEIKVILKQSFLAYQEEKVDMKLRFDNIVKKLKSRGFLKANKLTEKGDFAAQIYADEIETAEIFATTFADKLSDYEIFVILGMFAYEPKDKDKFYKPQKHNKTQDLRRKLRHVRAIENDERFRYMFEMASLVEPCYDKGSFFDIVDLTNQSEGDLIRLFSQMLDRLRQIRRASFNMNLNDKLDVLQDKIRLFLNDVKEI
tara:strand:+ start:4812 stop:6713 length:1902 start_codon:yes stop_codon:yes gene_type:complete